MHNQDFTNLIANADLAGASGKFKEFIRSKDRIPGDVDAMEALAKSNSEHLADVQLEDNMRIPTTEDITRFRNFAIEYKRANPKASKRKIRLAVQKQFNIRIYK